MQRLVFLHIPRTGGTSLRAVLDEVYGRKSCLNLPDFADAALAAERIARFTAKRRRPPAVLSGHMNFGLHEADPGRYITIMRDPVERVVSTYFFALKRGYRVARDADGAPVPLETFVDPERRGHGLVNMQAMMIAGLYAATPRLPGPDFAPPPNESAPPSQLLAKALANLKRFAAVMITEDFDQSLQRVADALRWPPVRATVRNAAPRSSYEVPTRTRRLIEHICAIDLELYQHARDRIARVPAFGFRGDHRHQVDTSRAAIVPMRPSN